MRQDFWGWEKKKVVIKIDRLNKIVKEDIIIKQG